MCIPSVFVNPPDPMYHLNFESGELMSSLCVRLTLSLIERLLRGHVSYSCLTTTIATAKLRKNYYQQKHRKSNLLRPLC